MNDEVKETDDGWTEFEKELNNSLKTITTKNEPVIQLGLKDYKISYIKSLKFIKPLNHYSIFSKELVCKCLTCLHISMSITKRCGKCGGITKVYRSFHFCNDCDIQFYNDFCDNCGKHYTKVDPSVNIDSTINVTPQLGWKTFGMWWLYYIICSILTLIPLMIIDPNVELNYTAPLFMLFAMGLPFLLTGLWRRKQFKKRQSNEQNLGDE